MKTVLTRFALIGTLSVFIIGCSTVGGQHRLLEYQVDTVWVKSPHPIKEFQDYLNAKAQDGWKLVGFEEHDNNFRVVLTRPKK
jgi:hypothetical protein